MIWIFDLILDFIKETHPCTLAADGKDGHRLKLKKSSAIFKMLQLL